MSKVIISLKYYFNAVILAGVISFLYALILYPLEWGILSSDADFVLHEVIEGATIFLGLAIASPLLVFGSILERIFSVQLGVYQLLSAICDLAVSLNFQECEFLILSIVLSSFAAKFFVISFGGEKKRQEA